jgi:flagellar hook-basal body complex protein FliE
MNLSSIQAATAGSIAGNAPAASPPASPPGGFGRLLNQVLGDAGTHQAKAEQAVQNLVAGRADNVHNVMLAMAKADLSFHLVLEIRNRLSEAYQEIMRMQV